VVVVYFYFPETKVDKCFIYPFISSFTKHPNPCQPCIVGQIIGRNRSYLWMRYWLLQCRCSSSSNRRRYFGPYGEDTKKERKQISLPDRQLWSSLYSHWRR
jgi:hypothetical protein